MKKASYNSDKTSPASKVSGDLSSFGEADKPPMSGGLEKLNDGASHLSNGALISLCCLAASLLACTVLDGAFNGGGLFRQLAPLWIFVVVSIAYFVLDGISRILQRRILKTVILTVLAVISIMLIV